MMMNKPAPAHGAVFLAAAFLAACSSLPERPQEVFTLQNRAETQMVQANKEADHGNHASALDLLDEAWRLAVATDRPALRARVAVARGNTLFYLNRKDEAAALWKNAGAEAEAAGETALAALCRVHLLRGRLDADNAAEVLGGVRAEMDALKTDALSTAFAWTVTGLAQKELGQSADAELSLMNALAVHEKERYLEQTAYDWYLIASVRSVAGNYAGAQAALDAAINFDRRAENSFALGLDWAAKGDVYLKTGNNEDAAAAWRRSADIFRAVNRDDQAAAVEKRLNP
jgi:tetratricopeptide (TPR) repeat protein